MIWIYWFLLHKIEFCEINLPRPSELWSIEEGRKAGKREEGEVTRNVKRHDLDLLVSPAYN